ncbi:hypothetical protein BJ741DRAFT_604310 [Chytriomyces cf. hyalinus JEL632]|nr:hypothetical protein BJ741DRAFT_604310 [Chytriomyces cf. hyalinus JEL632]
MSSLPISPQTPTEAAYSNATDIADYLPESTSPSPAGDALTDSIMGAPKGVFLGSIAGGACAMIILLVVACFCVGHVRRKERARRAGMSPMAGPNQGMIYQGLQLDMNSTAAVKRAPPTKSTILRQQAPSRVDKVIEWLAANDAANSSHFSVSTGRRQPNVPLRIPQNQRPRAQAASNSPKKRALRPATASNPSKQNVASKSGQKVGETSVTTHAKPSVPKTESSTSNYKPVISSGAPKTVSYQNELEPLTSLIPDPLPFVVVAMAKKAETKSNAIPTEIFLRDPVGATLVQKTGAGSHGTKLPYSSVVKKESAGNQTAAAIGTTIRKEDTALQPESSGSREAPQQLKRKGENNEPLNSTSRPKRKSPQSNPKKSKSAKLATAFSSNKTIGTIASKHLKGRVSPPAKPPSFNPPDAVQTHFAILQPVDRKEPDAINTLLGSSTSDAHCQAPLIDSMSKNVEFASLAKISGSSDQILKDTDARELLEMRRKEAKFLLFEAPFKTSNQVDSASAKTDETSYSRSYPRAFPWSKRRLDIKNDQVHQIETVIGKSSNALELTRPEPPLVPINVHSQQTMGLMDQLMQCSDRPQVSLEKRYSYMLQKDQQQQSASPMPLSSPESQHIFTPLPNWNSSDPFVSSSNGQNAVMYSPEGYPVAYQVAPMYPEKSMLFPPAEQHGYSQLLPNQSYIDAWWRDYYEKDPVGAQEAYCKMGGSFNSDAVEMSESGEKKTLK